MLPAIYLPFLFLSTFLLPSSSSSIFSTQIVKEREEESGESFLVEFIGNSFKLDCMYERRERKKRKKKQLAGTKTLWCLG